MSPGGGSEACHVYVVRCVWVFFYIGEPVPPVMSQDGGSQPAMAAPLGGSYRRRSTVNKLGYSSVMSLTVWVHWGVISMVVRVITGLSCFFGPTFCLFFVCVFCLFVCLYNAINQFF